MKDTLKRESDLLNHDCNMEELFEFKKFPIFVGTTDDSSETDIFYDMTWDINKNNGLVQLRNLIPLDVLYKHQHISGIGKVWKEHHIEFANFIKKYDPKSVLEIGAAHGFLCSEYKKFKKIEWTIVEPNPTNQHECDAVFIKEFFDENFSYEEAVDTIVHSHVLEHIYEPHTFCEKVSEFLSVGKKLIFSIPNMKVMLERKYTNCLGFEHTYFLTEEYVEYILSTKNLKLVEKKYFLDDHSIFYCFEKDESVEPKQLKNYYQQNKNIFNEFIKYNKNISEEIQSFIENKENVFIFGAHIFTQSLLSFGLKEESIYKILDNDPQKQGKRLYGTNLFVESPKILKNLKEPIVILKAGAYTEEIREDIIKNINDTVIFL